MAKPNKKAKPVAEPAPVEKQEPEATPATAPLSAPAASVIPPAANLRVRMQVCAMGPGVSLEANKVYSLAAAFARGLIAGGYAVELAEDSGRETR